MATSDMTPMHRNILDAVTGFFNYQLQKPRGYRMLREAKYAWPEDIDSSGKQQKREPDLSVLLFPAHVKGLSYTDPPVFVAEVLSRSTAAYDPGEKQRLYAKVGIPEYWIIDPENRRVDIFCLDDDDENRAYHLARTAVLDIAEDTPAAHTLVHMITMPEIGISKKALLGSIESSGEMTCEKPASATSPSISSSPSSY